MSCRCLTSIDYLWRSNCKEREVSVYDGKRTERIYTVIKNTMIEIYNSGKILEDLNSKYGISKSAITGWLRKSKPISVDKNTTLTTGEYQ